MTKFMKLFVAVAACVFISTSASAYTTVPGSDMSGPPGAVEFNGKLWVFFEYFNSPLRWGYQTMDATGTWSSIQYLSAEPSTTDWVFAPRAVVFNNRLYLFWSQNTQLQGRQYLWYRSMDQFGTWSTAKTIPNVYGSDNVGLAVYNGVLHAAWNSDDTPTVFTATMTTNETWTSGRQLSTALASNGPTMTVFNNILWAFWRDQGGTYSALRMWYAKNYGSGWGSTAVINNGDNPLTSQSPELVSTPSKMFLFFKGGTDSSINMKTMNTAHQWTQEVIVPGGEVTHKMSCVYFNNNVYVFYAYGRELRYVTVTP
jgi:hypothetical protein